MVSIMKEVYAGLTPNFIFTHLFLDIVCLSCCDVAAIYCPPKV